MKVTVWQGLYCLGLAVSHNVPDYAKQPWQALECISQQMNQCIATYTAALKEHLHIFSRHQKKSRIRETKHLSTDADSSTDAIGGWTKNTPKPDFPEKRKKSPKTQKLRSV